MTLRKGKEIKNLTRKTLQDNLKCYRIKKKNQYFTHPRELSYHIQTYLNKIFRAFTIELFTLTFFRKLGKSDLHGEYEGLMETPPYKQIFLNPILNEKAKAKLPERVHEDESQHRDVVEDVKQKVKFTEKIWLEIKKEETINLEEQRSRKERLSVIEEFERLQTKVKQICRCL